VQGHNVQSQKSSTSARASKDMWPTACANSVLQHKAACVCGIMVQRHSSMDQASMSGQLHDAHSKLYSAQPGGRTAKLRPLHALHPARSCAAPAFA